MKLAHRITSRISLALLVLMAVWATIFYFVIVEEINDETDDSLEQYSEYIITSALAGETLPTRENGTNNSYHLSQVPPEYSMHHPAIRYHDETVYVESKNETEPARVLRTIFSDSNGQYYELTVSVPTIEKSDLQEAILYWIIFLYLGLLIVTIGLNYLILHRSFKPLYKLLGWLNNFSLEKRFDEPRIDTDITEFRKLNEAVIQSSYRQIETYQEQRSFIGNASHELQTPLAVCLNRLEMLSDDDQLNQAQLGEILKTKQSIEYAIKLNRTLLLLTKIENNQFSDKKEFDVNRLINKMADDYSQVYANLGISTKIEEHDKARMIMDETLINILIGNLLKNAYIHNRPGGDIHIRIASNSLAIANTGPLEALNADRIFDRFYQGAQKEGSSGLGLALSRSICKLYGIELIYGFSEGKHFFTLIF